jgi:hypothetical protein
MYYAIVVILITRCYACDVLLKAIFENYLSSRVYNNSPEYLNKVVTRFISRSPKSQLLELLKSKEPGISLYACWRLTKHTMPIGANNLDIEELMNKFIMHTEKKINMEVPLFWREGLLYATKPGKFFLSKTGKVETKLCGGKILNGIDVVCFCWWNLLIVRGKGQTFAVILYQVPYFNNYFFHELHYYNCLEVMTTLKKIYFINHSQLCDRYLIHCYDIKTKKFLFTLDVWTGYFPIERRRFELEHVMTIIENESNKYVYVFGIDLTTVYVECFSTIDGKNIFRFSSSFLREY